GGFAPAWWGHAGTKQLRVVALAVDWAHVLAVTAWVGGLAALIWLAVRHRDVALAQPVLRFSRLAGWALAAVLATGVANTLFGMDDPAQLTDTTWGRLVLAKLAVLAALAWLGQRQRERVVPRLSSGADPQAARRAFRSIALAEVGLMIVGLGLATTMASGIPADAEASARIQSIAVAFGDGQINATVDPAAAGSNYLHLYVLDDVGMQRDDVTDPAVTFESAGTTVDSDLLGAGPGHWIAPAVILPTPGTWRVRVTATVAGQPTSASGAITVR
ncbi:MAG: CopD family protein, partial [Euzebyales bacterium]|nr:CopD family protein [Euzebyales bacterium]